MRKQIEALKLALEALEYIYEGANNQGPHTGISWRCVSNKAEPAITVIREALAEQPAQQPFGQVTVVRRPGFVDEYWFYRWPEPPYLDNAAECHYVYTTSPPASKPWVGLTMDEITKLWDEIIKYAPGDVRLKDFAYAIEAKLRGKNAQPSNPLTDEQITKHFQEHIDTGSLLSFADGVRFAEAAHGITGEQK